MLWLLLPPPAAAAAATVALAATVTLATVILTTVSCAGKKQAPKVLDIADDQSVTDSSVMSKPTGGPSSNSSQGSDQSLKPRKDKTVDDISKRWKEGKTIRDEMDESDAEQDPKLIVPKTERSAKKAKDKKKLLFPPAKLVPPGSAEKPRPKLAALQPPSSEPESDTSAGTGPDKPMTTPAPDDGTYQCLGGLDESKKKTTVRRVSRIVRPPAAHEAVPRGRTPMCQPSPVGTPAAAAQAKDQSTPHAARRVPPAAATAAPAKPAAPAAAKKAPAGPTVEDYDPAAKTAGTDVSLLADRVAPQEMTPVAPSPAPRAIKCAPMPAQPAAAAQPPVIASAPGTPVRAAPRTPAAPPLVLPAASPGCRNQKTQEKTQADSPVRGKVAC